MLCFFVCAYVLFFLSLVRRQPGHGVVIPFSIHRLAGGSLLRWRKEDGQHWALNRFLVCLCLSTWLP